MPEDTLVEREDCPHGQRLILIKFVSYRKEDLCRGMADVVTSGAGDIYFQTDSFRARSGKRKSGLGLGLGLREAGGYRLQVGRGMRIGDCVS